MTFKPKTFIPPNSTEAEKYTLGCLLQDSSLFYDIEFLGPEDYYDNRHKTIAEAISTLKIGGKPVDLLTVSSMLEDSGKLEGVGGRSYIAQLAMVPFTQSSIKEYARIVKEKSIRRSLLWAQDKIHSLVYEEDVDIETILAQSQKTVMDIDLAKTIDDSSASVVKDLESAQAEYEQKYRDGKKHFGFSCGFEKIDNAVDGMRKGHVWVVGAWTSTGKSQFALNVAHAAIEQNVPTSIVSLEMSRVDMAARLIGIRHNLSTMGVLKSSTLAREEGDKIKEGKKFLSFAPLRLHTTYFELEKIKMIIRKDHYVHKTQLFIVDYVQNIMTSDGQTEYETMTQAAVDFQCMARELGVVIYIVSQISNESQKGQGAGAGFKGTGALEAVADIAIRLERDKTKEDPSWPCVPLTVKITKNRHGFTGNTEYGMWLKSGKIDENALPPAFIASRV